MMGALLQGIIVAGALAAQNIYTDDHVASRPNPDLPPIQMGTEPVATPCTTPGTPVGIPLAGTPGFQPPLAK